MMSVWRIILETARIRVTLLSRAIGLIVSILAQTGMNPRDQAAPGKFMQRSSEISRLGFANMPRGWPIGIAFAVSVAHALGGLTVASAAPPSFDCAKATTELDQLICGNDELSGLDTELAAAYRDRLARSPNARERWITDQRAWLADRGFACRVIEATGFHSKPGMTAPRIDCLKDLYRNRKAALAQGEFFYKPPQPAHTSPSFDCKSATTVIERLICGNDELSSLDVEVANAYEDRLVKNPDERDRWIRDQRLWLFGRTSACFAYKNNESSQTWRTVATKCIRDIYLKRKDALARREFFSEPPKIEVARARTRTGPQEARQFDLAMSKDDGICKPVLEFYRRVGRQLLLNRDELWEESRSDLLKSLGLAIAPRVELQTLDNDKHGAENITSIGPFSSGAYFMKEDLFGDGLPRLVAIANEMDLHGDIKRPFAQVYRWPGPSDLDSAKSRQAFFEKPDLRVIAVSYSDALPSLDWVPVQRYDSQDDDTINIWSGGSRLFLMKYGRGYHSLERELDVNSEIRVFDMSAPKDIYDPQMGFNKHRLDSLSVDVCYISPNIEHQR